MNAETARVLERVRQIRAARAAAAQRAGGVSPVTPSMLHGSRVAGARAFDTVTGQDVEVISVGSENVVVPTAQG